MHPDKGSRSVRTDVLTDSETIYEAYVRVLNSLILLIYNFRECMMEFLDENHNIILLEMYILLRVFMCKMEL